MLTSPASVRRLSAWTLAIFLAATVASSPSAYVVVPDSPDDPAVPYATSGVASRIYWVDFTADSIQAAGIDGSGYQSLAHSGVGSSYFVRLDLDGDYMYWTEVENNIVFRSRLNGAQRETLFTTGFETDSAPYGIDVDFAAGKVYWTDSGFPRGIHRANLDGSNVEDLVTTGLFNPFDIHLDLPSGKMYWTDIVLGLIKRADTSGTNVETLLSGLGLSYDMDLDLTDGKIYWIDSRQKIVARSNLNGSELDTLAMGSTGCLLGVAVDHDAGWVYFSHCKKIFRVNFEATVLEELPIPGLDKPFGLTLEFPQTIGVGPRATVPQGLRLGAPRPIPAMDRVSIDLLVGTGGRVRVEVFDVQGRRVATVLDSELPAGTHAVVWNGHMDNGRQVTNGVYLIRASGSGETASRSVVIVR